MLLIVGLLMLVSGMCAQDVLTSRFSSTKYFSNLFDCAISTPSFSLSTPSKLRCAMKCLENANCFSFNWKDDISKCEVYARTVYINELNNVDFCRYYSKKGLSVATTTPQTTMPPTTVGKVVLSPNFVNIASNCAVPFPAIYGWTVIQRRCSGAVDFYRTYSDYTYGFGSLTGEFWIGLEWLTQKTMASALSLRIDLQDMDGIQKYAIYSTFQVGAASTNYKLTIGGYSGDATDAYAYSNNWGFTTYDNPHDSRTPENCAIFSHGGGWYANCHYANPNGWYGSTTFHQGVNWATYKDHYYSMPYFQMRVSLA